MPDSILIIENEALMREALVDILNFADMATIDVKNGHEAISTFEVFQESISLVIMDMRLPDLDGSEILLALESIQPDVKVIVASGEDEQKLTYQFRTHPNVSILPKPYDIDVMLSQVRQRLAA